MRLKLEDVVPYAMAVKAIFDANPGVKVYDTTVGGTWEVDVFEAAIAAVEEMASNLAIQKQKTDDYKKCQALMKSARPNLKVLGFKVKQCIKNGTITDAYKSFGISECLDAITRKDINAFHAAYLTLSAQIGDTVNRDALIAVGYTTGMMGDLKTIHNAAYALRDARILDKREIKDNTAANTITVNVCNGCSFQGLSSLNSYGYFTGNVSLIAQTTQAAVKKTITPTQPKKPRNKRIKATESIIAYTNMLANRMLQFTLKTGGVGIVFIGRTDTKDGIPTEMMALTKDLLLNIKNADIPGTGRYIKIINTGLIPAVVLCFVIVP